MGDAIPLPDPFGDDELVLRLPVAEDVDRITEICQDPDIQRFTRVPVPYGRQDAESFLAMASETLQQGRGAHLVVQVQGDVVGCVGASIDLTDQVASVGYWTDRQARRQGITARAVHLMCRWLLEDIGVARIELDAATTNPGSNAVAESLGFRLEGMRRLAMLLSAAGGLPADRVDAHHRGLLPGELRGRSQ